MCEFTSMSSLIAHVTRKHAIPMPEYRRLYPDDVIQRAAPSTRAKLSAVGSQAENVERLLKNRSFPSEVKHWTRKGLTDEEASRKVSEYQIRAALKQNAPDVKLRQSVRNTGDSNPMSLRSIAAREGVSLREASQRTPAYGRVGPAHPMFGRKHSNEALIKISSAHHLTQPEFRSRGELELADECRKLGDIAENSYVVGGNVDIVFRSKKLVVEFFGDMWHMNRTRYAPHDVNPVTGMTATERWERDDRKHASLQAAGYTVVVVWESDWKYERERVLKEVEDAYNRA